MTEADRKSDLNKAWKRWKRHALSYRLSSEDVKRHALSYNSWFEFATENGATDEEADDLWDSNWMNRNETF